jgi:hypothetical protein
MLGLLSIQSTEIPVAAAELASEGSVDQSHLRPFLEDDGDVVLFDFENPDEIDRFVYGDVNTFVETTTDVARTGSTSCSATYYVGATRQGKRLVFYTLMHPARGRLSDWTPYLEFQAAILNNEDFSVDLEVEYGDGVNSVWRKYSIPPGVWCRIRQPLSDLAGDGLDISSVKRISWSMLDTTLPGICTLYMDDIRLVASDTDASRTAVAEAWTAYEDWDATQNSGPREQYLPVIHTDEGRISEIENRYDCGDLDGYVITGVLVVGGEISGSCAAIASGRLGVDTLIVEAYAFLGGTVTAAMVTPFMSNRTGGHDLVKGIYQDIIDALLERGGARRDSNDPGEISIDKEQLKYILNDLVINAGTKMMLQTWAEMPLVYDNKCEGIVVLNKSGRLAILADITVDTTGDGDMAAKAGCPYEIGRGYDEYTQSNTLYFRIAGVNDSVAFAELGRRTARPGGVVPENYLFADIFRQAVADGRFPADIPINSVYYDRTVYPGTVSINATRVFEVNGTNVNDLTYGAVETRRQAVLLADLMRENFPGFENSYLQETGTEVFIRETRRILGEYQLTACDVLTGRDFSDAIALGAFGIDIHVADYTGGGVVGLDLPPGESYGIPYRCLVPLDIDNILVGGRCISVSHVAFGSSRVEAISSGTGHAAGVAAALCVLKNTTPRELDYPSLRDALLDQGAILE